jgi:hypothetical protein
MKEIRNKTNRPLRIPLPGGKTLHLGPSMVAQITDKATEHEGLQELIEEGSIEIVGEGERSNAPTDSRGGLEQTHGRAKSTFRRGHGER